MYLVAWEVQLSEINSLRIMESGLGFWQAKCLLSAIELGLFTELGRGQKKGKEIGAALGLHPKGIPDFLDGLVAMKFLERDGNGDDALYGNTEETARFLDRNSAEYMAGYLEMANSRLFPFWVGLTETLRTGQPQNEVKGSGPQIFDELYSDPGRLEQYVRAMSGIGISNFRAFAEKFDFSSFRTLCDVGGASGRFSIEVARAHPQMACVTCDLPAVRPIAERTIAEAGLTGSISAFSCDMFKDPFPRADVITMGMVLHNWSHEEQMFLIRKAYDSLPSGGAFAIVENLIDDERRENLFGLMMSLNMLVSCGNAADFTGQAFAAWCRQVGFRRTEVLHLSGALQRGRGVEIVWVTRPPVVESILKLPASCLGATQSAGSPGNRGSIG